MPLTADRGKSPLHDQKTELKRKIQLLEGERAAYYERSQSTIKKNEEDIRQIRQENKLLHKKMAEAKAGDEEIIRRAFQNRGSEKEAFRSMSARDACKKLDQLVLSKTKRLNAMKHTTQTYQQRLDELRMERNLLRPEGSGGAVSSDVWAQKEEDAMRLRSLENSLEKTQLKHREAEKIMVYYLKLKKHLQNESLTYQGHLDSLEAEILTQREVLQNLQVRNNEAQLTKEATKAELHQEEQLLSRKRKERERKIIRYKKMLEESDALAGKSDRKVQQTAMQPDELSNETQRSTTRNSAEKETTSTLEEAFRGIKDDTGITDIQEIVQRFTSQKKMHQYLEQLKRENEEVLLQLRDQKELLKQKVEDTKYSGDAELSQKQQLLKEHQHQLQATQQRCNAAKERLDLKVKTLSTVRAGVEHLAEKLQHITLNEDGVIDVHPDSDEFVLELLKQCELKSQVLQTELEAEDLDALMKEMEIDEFYDRIEENLPESNTRVKFLQDRTPESFDDEDKSEEKEPDVVSREALKRQSQQIINANFKKAWKKKKKKGKF